ncbi:putative cellulase (glycosyl hydrolase family 5) [Lyophyllum shimeji]|uniref:Cellulase (Glycosyl hydrolase family 5) n=1 Tax=Lyophyllum shimeji TaxID=47721 RepID=A0A9P3PHK7_LYOSH|nr:putative cellulase (glycosyl hydrolase family 5) [Lyophyllum shimeji]
MPDSPSLSACYSDHYARLGQLDDLEKALEFDKSALKDTPVDDSSVPQFQNNLGSTYIHRYERLGCLDDFEAALSLLRAAVEEMPSDHARLPHYQSNLVYVYMHSSKKVDVTTHLENAFRAAMDALDGMPTDHPDLPELRRRIAEQYTLRYDKKFGHKEDLDAALRHAQRAVDGTPASHADLVTYQTTLATAYHARYRATGMFRDLDAEFLCWKAAVEGTPSDHPLLPKRHSGLAGSYIARHELFHGQEDFDSALRYSQSALDGAPLDHPDFPKRQAKFEALLQSETDVTDFAQTIHAAEAGGASFVGQPLNLDDGTADVHLARLRGWGFNMLRFPITWEALEHEGPGKYDYEFMDYTIRVLHKCKQYGFKVYLDPHQDTWSRFSGGSGAPFWTLPACGINPRNLTATQSAIIHNEYPLAHVPDPASLPAMIWSTNYGRLLCQTVFTLFFAGRVFAPRCIIDGKNIQDWLQEHYIAAFGALADRIRAAGGLYEDCVIGWDSLNEPFEGLCGWENLNQSPSKQGSTLKKGTHPTPAQSLRLGMGQAQTVENWTFGALGPSRAGTVTIDPKGKKIWADPEMETPEGVNERWGWKRDLSKWKLGVCVWAQHGVWDVETGFILREDYFRYMPDTGEPVDFIPDFWKPHFLAFAKRIRAAQPESILFVQPPVFARPPKLSEEVLKGRCGYSPHYYDGLTLVTRHWNWFNADALGLLRGKYTNTLQAVKIGEGAIRRSLQEQLGMLRADVEILGPYPTVIGEIGTPFDMDNKRSYGWTEGGKHKGDYSMQEKALDASLNGADGENALNWTVWTYCTDHTHDWGDGWNMEDLSIWSPDDLQERQREDESNQSADGDEEQEQQRGDSDRESLYDAKLGDSRAALLRKDAKRNKDQSTVTVRPAGASTVSLDTVGNTDANTTTEEQPKRAPSPSPSSVLRNRNTPTLRDWRKDPYRFLTDGARAVRAFCRPWPHKIVGVPVDMSFEIGKAHFKLVVRVSAEDALVGVVEDEDEKRKGEGLATEIYVPIVHFAAARVLGAESGPEGEAGLGLGRGVMEGHRRSGSVEDNEGKNEESGRSTAVGSRWASSVDLPSSVLTDDGSSAGTSATASPEIGNAPLPGMLRDLVDVSVKVSAGRWEVQGQTLRWWYDVPKEGEESREHTIEITRRPGPIKNPPGARALGAPSEGGGEKSWWERWCGEEACCVM